MPFINDLKNLESIKNKVTEINENSTDNQYPSAKSVYDFIGGGGFDDKVEQIDYENRENPNDTDWGYSVGVYGKKANNTSALFKATKALEANTIPVRDGSGAIAVSINIKDSDGNNYTGGAAPHTWVADQIQQLSNKIQTSTDTEAQQRVYADQNLQKNIDATNSNLDALKLIVNAKKITKITLEAGGTIILKKNTLYAFLHDGSDNTVSILNNGAVQYEGEDDELTMKFGLIMIPENTQGGSEEYPPSYYSLALVDKAVSFLGQSITSLSSKKFSILKEVMDANGVTARENSGSATFSVWELAL